jgi:arylsulfatase A-like enzyme
MMSGRYMHQLGHRTQTHLIRDYEPNFFRVLKEAGYHVEFLGKNDM